MVDTQTNARLMVIFDNWFARLFGSSREGYYWILDLDPEYRTALVGTPDRRYLWILTREPRIDDDSYKKLVQLARAVSATPLSVLSAISAPTHRLSPHGHDALLIFWSC